MKESIKTVRKFTGQVVSAKMNKTLVVKVDTMQMNSKYQKKFRISKKYYVHDEKQAAKTGDTVTFVECRPMSKTKRWRLASVITSK